MTTDATTTPARAAAPRRRVLAQAGFELGSLLRNGEQLLVSLVLPSLALVGLSLTASPS
ncbi:MAG: ABC transporter permease, partial [Dermatophilaceae bacterium]|nr:ABC transporter permease [Dermatophilaceae bacterium]